MGPIQLVVFDLAGTTVDDHGMVLECFIETVHAYDLPSTPEELNALMGLNKREVLGMLAGRRYSPGSPEAEQLADKALAHFIEQMSAAYDRHLAPIPGAEKTFAFLRARDIKIATDIIFLIHYLNAVSQVAKTNGLMRRIIHPFKFFRVPYTDSIVLYPAVNRFIPLRKTN